MAMIEISELRDRFSYEPETGVFRWKIKVNRHTVVGSQAGYLDKHGGYVVLTVNKKQVGAHRVAWAMTTGAWPPDLIDHINTERGDNRFANLRPADRSLNAKNTRASRGLPPWQ